MSIRLVLAALLVGWHCDSVLVAIALILTADFVSEIRNDFRRRK